MKTTLPWYSSLQLLPSCIYDPWSPPTLSLPYDPPLHWPSDSDKCAAITGDRDRRNIISFVPWSSNIYCQQKLHKNLKLLASAIRNQENLISGEKERPVELSRDLITLSKNIDLSDLLNHGMKRNFVGNSIKKRKSFLRLPSEICYFCYLFYKLHKQS